MSLAQTINDAKKSIRKMKKTSPYLFTEYQEYNRALNDLEFAQDNARYWKEQWNKLGN